MFEFSDLFKNIIDKSTVFLDKKKKKKLSVSKCLDQKNKNMIIQISQVSN